MNPSFVRILLVEDNPEDVLLFKLALDKAKKGNYELFHARRLSEAFEHLKNNIADVAMLDLSLPDGFGMETVKTFHATAPQVPLVILTGLESDETGLAAIRSGAQDYLFKGEITARFLGRSIDYAIERGKLRRDLEDALGKVKLLSGLLPICASCKKIRDDNGYWNQIEVYLRNHSEATFTHGCCPECTAKMLGNFSQQPNPTTSE
jgi:DNA-binding NtrC family response regulator